MFSQNVLHDVNADYAIMPTTGNLPQDVFEQLIRADERAQEAHRRLSRHDDLFVAIQTEMAMQGTQLGEVKVAVAKIGVRVAIMAGLASLAASGVSSLIIGLWLAHHH